MRSRASEILDSTYCPAMYPTPSTPAPMAKLVLFRRSHRREADIMMRGTIAVYYETSSEDSHVISTEGQEVGRWLYNKHHDLFVPRHRTTYPSHQGARRAKPFRNVTGLGAPQGGGLCSVGCFMSCALCSKQLEAYLIDLVAICTCYQAMDQRDARRPPEYILEVFADPTSIKDVVRGAQH